MENARICIWCVVLFVAIASNGGGVCNVQVDDGVTLLLLKADITDPMGHLRDWKRENSTTFCKWSGVKCNRAGRIISLDLSGMNLTGNLSRSIHLLSELEILNLASNGFSGELPSSLQNVTRLAYLNLSRNSFVGRLPDGLSRNLIILTTYSNNFSGALTQDLGMLRKLRHLDLRGSYFQGGIPSSYANLKDLEFLGLSGNNLSGKIPKQLGKLSKLKTLILAYNSFESEIPKEIGNLTMLEYLDLASCGLSGSIPPEIGRLKNLTTLFLFNNRLNGSIPKEIGEMTSLVSLDLSMNSLSGSIPESIGNLKKLRLFSVMFNSLNGSVPSSISLLPKLVTLQIWNNSLSGSLPSDLGLHSPLELLDVSSNNLSGNIPPSLCNGKKLTRLILFNNKFSGPVPRSLVKCQSLWRARLQNNKLSGSIPSGFGLLPNLTRLELGNNNISGIIPVDLGLSSSISFLDISNNRIGGILHSAIFSMPSLQTFNASTNHISGEVPSDFSNCQGLLLLDLSYNRISGTIPSNLGRCNKVIVLDMKRNKLNGRIPPQLGRMSSLAVLDLSENHLSGRIPYEITNATNLQLFNFSCNELSGKLPSQGVFRSVNPDAFIGNPLLCGETILRLCFMNSHPIVTKRRPSPLAWLLGVISAVALALSLLGGRLIYKRIRERFKKRLYMKNFNGRNSKNEWPWRLIGFQRLGFTSSDILDCIKESNIIGSGGTGTVYKAEMSNGEIVAVKRLWMFQSHDNVEKPIKKEPSFMDEVELLGKLRHRNIVKILGYCYNNTNPVLIYEYMPNGSLADALHGKNSRSNLLTDWVIRYNIALGIAQGLCYLHHDCLPVILHRDVKSNNILLDSNLEARVADFGLARLIEANDSMSTIAGSYGYIAPEYAYTLKVDEKSDIYSFGVVLMELLTGKKAVEAEYGEGINIVGWIRSKLQQNDGLLEALDSNVARSSETVKDEMTLVLRIALLCTSKSPKDRPSMRDVVTMLSFAQPRRKSPVTTTLDHEHSCYSTIDIHS